MKVERYTPATRLQPFIKDYMFIESENELENCILPGTSITMAIRYSGNISMEGNHLSPAVLSGIRRSPKHVHYASQTGNLLVNFTPGGAAAFFYEPLNELADLCLPANYLDNYPDIHQLSERLTAAITKAEKVTHLEQVLLSKLIKSQPEPLIGCAIQKIQSAAGMIPIKELSRELYISQDAFEKRFRQTVGTSPKHFSTIIRLRNAIDKHSAGNSLTDTALTAGYYDQAHFIKDFKGFTGRSPGHFFRDRQYW